MSPNYSPRRSSPGGSPTPRQAATPGQADLAAPPASQPRSERAGRKFLLAGPQDGAHLPPSHLTLRDSGRLTGGPSTPFGTPSFPSPTGVWPRPGPLWGPVFLADRPARKRSPRQQLSRGKAAVPKPAIPNVRVPATPGRARSLGFAGFSPPPPHKLHPSRRPGSAPVEPPFCTVSRLAAQRSPWQRVACAIPNGIEPVLSAMGTLDHWTTGPPGSPGTSVFN
ncbi:nascent polypeptide-associated complex subunit alpha, muscle-specific form-like [Dama dama]|uniref:nascent polypeptide-associated complex subunit alpha, muscle-specific form-like n=1 Tax=Dama dama TaxID=30532 RepID=UPI002A3702E0|nr:nascent polypeptide-associated complex subunit alpha, muscle-specific form-like [Dama dama]